MDIKSVDRFRKRNRILILLAIAGVTVLCLEFSDINNESAIIGSILIFIGMMVRLWTNGTIVKSKEVCDRGPYSIARHPMYFGTAIASIGVAILLNHLVFIALVLIAIVISFIRAKREEEKLAERFPEYNEYRKRVPAIPTPFSMARALKSGALFSGWSLGLTYENGEVSRINLYFLMVLISLIYLKFRNKFVVDDLYYHASFLSLLILSVFSFLLYPKSIRNSKALFLLCMLCACFGSFLLVINNKL